MQRMKLNIGLLALCQAIAQSGNTNLATTGALIGLGLTGSEAKSTWPMAASIFATLLTTIPASLFMARYGRRAGFLIAFASGVAVLGTGVLAADVTGMVAAYLGH